MTIPELFSHVPFGHHLLITKTRNDKIATKSHKYLIIAGLFLSLFTLLFVGSEALPTQALERTSALPKSTQASYTYPPGNTLVPLGTAQGAPANPIPLREVYETLFNRVYDDSWNKRAIWTASTVAYNSEDYDPGTLIAPIPSSDYTYTNITSSIEITRAFSLQPIRIGVFYSSVRDEFDQVVTWEEGDWEQLFRVYLWGETYFETLTETQVIAGDLANYDLFILPSIRIGYADDVADALGTQGLAAMREWVEAGGILYSQSEATYLVERAGLVPEGTVDPDTRVTDADNVADLALIAPGHPLTFSWLDNTAYVLNEPLITATTGISVVARYQDTPGNTTQPGSVAIAAAYNGDGKAILVSSHPSDKRDYLPQALDGVLWAMARRAGLWGSLQQGFAPTAPANVIPAYVADVPITVTVTFANYWDNAMQTALITETVSAGFTVDAASVSHSGTVITNPDGTTTITWTLGTADPGDTDLTYVVRTEENTLAGGSAKVSIGEATYNDPNENNAPFHLTHKPLYVHAQMPARLEGDRDIELDAIYPLPEDGYVFDMALSLENKEATQATDVVVVDVVPLVSPIVDVVDQRAIPHVLTDTVTYSEAPTSTLWARNEVFFYAGMPYPLPAVQGVTATVTSTYSLAEWDGTTVYTFTGPFTTTAGYTNAITIPPAYTSQITLTTEGDLMLPAVVMTWTLDTLAGYDWAEPILRYGLFSTELFSRTVSFASDPVTPSLVLDCAGGSVYAALGGDPIPYRDYLTHAVTHIPVPSTLPRVDYKDLWGREQSMPLRTSFYDIVPFPPPEEHTAINTTFQLLADFDGDETYTDTLLNYPARNGAQMRMMIKTRNNYETLGFEQDETLMRVGMFKGLGVMVNPANATWDTSWSDPDDDTVLTGTLDVPGYTHLLFNQRLPADETRTVYITATLSAYEGMHKEGSIKLHDGVRYIYHQIAAGPSRYEVYDTHPQATFGIQNDIAVDKHVAPVLVATYDDTLYHFIEIEDPWDPREFPADPSLRSYGFGDSTATVYVGGSEGRKLLSPKLNPGEKTRVRVELNNNTGQTWQNVAITPTAPAGITVTAVFTDEALMPPVFFDLPFLHSEIITDAWKGVYYYEIEVDAGITRGEVYSITFDVNGSNVPAELQVPPAHIGVKDESGSVKYVLGRSVNLVLNDLLPTLVDPQAARWSTEMQKETLVHAIISDTTPTQSEIATAFNAMPSLPMATTVLSDGTQVQFDMTNKTLPWDDGTVEHGTMYVILKSHSTLFESGTNIANAGPVITYTGYFDQDWTAVGPERTVEVHGANVVADYYVDQITGLNSGDPLDGIAPREPSVVDASVNLYNRGDYIASVNVITMELASDVVISDAAYSYVQEGQIVTFTFTTGRDLAPGDSDPLSVTLVVSPTAGATNISAAANPPAGYTRVIVATGSIFTSHYPPLASAQDVTVIRPLLGPLDIAPLDKIYTLNLPLVLRNYLSAPDLTVESIFAASNDIQVVIVNQGDAPATAPFWVDIYIAPTQIPVAVNQTWELLCDQGLAWGVTTELQPGERITLTAATAQPDHTQVSWPLPAGTQIYAQADAAHTGTTYGGVLENHEILGETYNNILGPVLSSANTANTIKGTALDPAGKNNILPHRP